MASRRLYETTLLGEDGSRAGVISAPAPIFREPLYPPAELAMELANELGFEVRELELPARELLPALIGQAGGSPERMNLAAELVYAPLVIIELSPARGESLATLTAWSGGTASLAWAGASPVVILGWQAVLVVAWLLHPAGEEFREHLREVVASWRRRHPPD
jgi:hypothetical protein